MFNVQQLPSAISKCSLGVQRERLRRQCEHLKNDSFLPSPRAALINVACIFFSRPSITSLSSLRLGSNEGFTRNSWFSTYKQNKESPNYTDQWVKTDFRKHAISSTYVEVANGVTDHP